MTADLKNEKFIRMTTAPVGHLVSSLAVPSIISMLVPGIYNLADITGPAGSQFDRRPSLVIRLGIPITRSRRNLAKT